MSKILIFWMLGAAFSFADWLDSSRSDDTAYFFYADPPRAERYDLSTKSWLDPISLPVKDGALSAALADEDGMYLAYGTSVYRYNLDGENEAFILNRTTDITGILSNSGAVFVFSEGNRASGASFLKSNNTIASTLDSQFNSFENGTVSNDGKTLYSASGSTNRFTTITVDTAGAMGSVTTRSLANIQGSSSPNASQRVWEFPNGGKLFASGGSVYNEGLGTSFQEVIRTSFSATDLIFLGADIPIMVSGNQVIALKTNFTPTGSADLGFQGLRLFLSGDDVIAFGAIADGDMQPNVTVVSLSDLGDPIPGAPVDPLGAVYTPTSMFIDNGGVLNIFSSQYSTLFRWDTNSQTYLDSINLSGPVTHVAYAADVDIAYLGFADGRIDRINLRFSNPSQSNFVTTGLASIQNMVDAGSRLFVLEEWPFVRIVNRNGVLGERKFVTVSQNNPLLWDPRSQKVFYSDGGLESVAISGTTTGQENSNSGVRSTPVAFTAGNGVVTQSGQVANTSDLQLQGGSLANEIHDATLQGTALKSIREINGLTQLQTWEGNNFSPGISKQLPGTPLRIFTANSNRLIVVIQGGNGAPTFYVTNANFEIIPPASLAAPQNLQVGVTGAQSIIANWLDTSGEEEFVIERREGMTGDFVEIGRVGTSITEYVENGLDGIGSSYQYRVKAVNGTLESPYSEVQLVEFVLPVAPTNLEVSERTDRGFRVTWDAVPGASGYTLKYSDLLNPFERDVNQQFGPGNTSYIFTNLSSGREYAVIVTAINGLGAGPRSEITTSTLAPLPQTPTNVNGSNIASYQINVRWNGNSASGVFVLQRQAPGETEFVEIYRGTNRSYLDTNLAPTTTYNYRVRVENERGNSNFSVVGELATTQIALPARPNLVLSHRAGGILATWTSLDPTIETFRVLRQVDQPDTFEVIAEQSANEEFSFLDNTAQPGFRYTYRIEAVNVVGQALSDARQLLAIGGVCVIEDDFDTLTGPSFYGFDGGEIITDGGAGFPAGGVVHFNQGFSRALVTEPVEFAHGGMVSFTVRMGNSQVDGAEFWDDSELGENLFIQIENGSGGWQTLSSIIPVIFTGVNLPNPETQNWNTYYSYVPPRVGKVRIRIYQINFSGPGLDTWGIDSFCVLTNEPENIAPAVDPDAPFMITANPTGDPIRMNFSQYVSEENDLDTTYYEIGEVSNAAIFSSFGIDMNTGLLSIDFAPQSTGSSTLEVVITDRAGARTTHLFTVNAPVLQAPTIVREGLVELNPITGKYEQTLTIANNGTRPIAGVQVVVTSLNNGFKLDGFENNTAVSNTPLAPGETVSMVLEYHSEISGVAPRPDFIVQILSPTGEVVVPGGGNAGLRQLVDSSKVFSFDAVVGEQYQIQYSYDMVEWKTSPAIVTAGANRVNWLDQGQPKTDCHPSECTNRYYRVVPLR